MFRLPAHFLDGGRAVALCGGGTAWQCLHLNIRELVIWGRSKDIDTSTHRSQPQSAKGQSPAALTRRADGSQQQCVCEGAVCGGVILP
jgi:hypothetical protein